MEPKTRYYMFIIGRFISTFGNWFASMAVPFIIYDLTGSAMAVSLSFLLETLPVILLSPLISRQIDNYSRKILLQLCEAMSGLSILCCVLTSCDNIYVLYFMCMVLSVASFTYNTTVNAYVPDICGDLELKTANTIDSFASNVSMVIAPVLAGMCIEWKGYQVALIIDIGTFILSIVFLNFLQKDIRLRKAEAKTHYLKETFLSRSFLEWMNKEAFLRSLIIICILFSICGAIFSSLDAVYIAEIFDGSSDV
ncbi:MAG TPA: MFS transporter, partial [Candidatus Blautia avicola]|nr:MFS transporter [Candidatus Blautia avicola]